MCLFHPSCPAVATVSSCSLPPIISMYSRSLTPSLPLNRPYVRLSIARPAHLHLRGPHIDSLTNADGRLAPINAVNSTLTRAKESYMRDRNLGVVCRYIKIELGKRGAEGGRGERTDGK